MMADKKTIVEVIGFTGLVPLFYHDHEETAKRVVEAAYFGGARVFEFTNRGAKAFDVFRTLVKFCEHFDGFYLGIGTIMNQTDAKKFLEEGAQFLVSPIFKQELAEIARARNVLWMPGCATLTEIVNASEAGAEIIKIFPGSVLGPGFVSSVMPVIPGFKLMPTGGVEPTKENLQAWFKAGVYSVGMGSQLFTTEEIKSKNWQSLKSKVQSAMETIRLVRS